jgi:hypothetical protein
MYYRKQQANVDFIIGRIKRAWIQTQNTVKKRDSKTNLKSGKSCKVEENASEMPEESA